MDPFQKMQRQDIAELPEPKHVNYFFHLHGDPCNTLQTYQDISEYLDGFEYWGFQEKLKLDFLYHIRKYYKNVMVSIEKFNLEKIDEFKDYLEPKKLNKITSDECLIKILYSAIHIFEIIEVSGIEKEKKEEFFNSKVEIVKKSLIRTKEQLNTLLELLENEIELYEKISGKTDITNEIKFKKMWNEIVEEHFRNDIIITALDEVGYKNEDEFKAYMKKMYERRTTEEWIKYYDNKDLTEEIVERQKKAYEPEAALNFTRNLMSRNYSKSNVGIYTRENLEKFEEKYVHKEEKIYEKQHIKELQKLLPMNVVQDINTFNTDKLRKMAIRLMEMEFEGKFIEPELRELYIMRAEQDYNDLFVIMGSKDRINENIYNTFGFEEPLLEQFINKLDISQKGKYLTFIVKEARKLLIDLEEYLKDKKDEINYGVALRNILKFAPIKTMNKDIYNDPNYKVNLEKYLSSEQSRLNRLIKKYEIEIEFSDTKEEYNNKQIKKLNADIIAIGNDEQEKEPTQRAKIKEYLDDHNIDLKNDFTIILNGLARDITKYLYPTLSIGREKKAESIRQELMLMRKR